MKHAHRTHTHKTHLSSYFPVLWDMIKLSLYIFVSITNVTLARNNISNSNIHCESATVLGMSTGGAHQANHWTFLLQEFCEQILCTWMIKYWQTYEGRTYWKHSTIVLLSGDLLRKIPVFFNFHWSSTRITDVCATNTIFPKKCGRRMNIRLTLLELQCLGRTLCVLLSWSFRWFVFLQNTLNVLWVMNDKNCEVTGRHPLQLIGTRLTFHRQMPFTYTSHETHTDNWYFQTQKQNSVRRKCSLWSMDT